MEAIRQKRLTIETSPISPPTIGGGAGTLVQRVTRKNRAASLGLPPPWIPTFVVPITCTCNTAGMTVNQCTYPFAHLLPTANVFRD